MLDFHQSNHNVQHGTQTTEDGKVDVKFPLPPEGQNVPGLIGTLIGASHPREEHEEDGTWPSIAGTKRPEAARHWKEGWYIWTSKNRWATQEKIDLMMCDLERQTEWQKYKERVNQEWADNENREVQKTMMTVSDLASEQDAEKTQGADHTGSSPPVEDNHSHDHSVLGPPFPDAT